MTEGFGSGGENILRLMLNDINIGIVLICVSSNIISIQMIFFEVFFLFLYRFFNTNLF